MHNFYLSRKKRGISTSSLYNYYFFSWRIFVSRIEIYIWANIIWKIPLETSPAGIPLFYPSDAENIWGTITKQPVKIRETPERNWGLVGRHDRKILVSRRATLLNSLSLSLFSFLCCQITGIQSFHLWQIFIRGASHPSPPLLVVTAFVSKLLNYTLPR